MPYSVYFDLDGQSAPLVDFYYGFSRDTDSRTNKPTSKVRIDRLRFRVKSDRLELKNSIIQWVANLTMKDGRIQIYDNINPQNLLTRIEFRNGFAVQFQEDFIAASDGAMFFSFEVVAELVSVNGIPHDVNPASWHLD